MSKLFLDLVDQDLDRVLQEDNIMVQKCGGRYKIFGFYSNWQSVLMNYVFLLWDVIQKLIVLCYLEINLCFLLR